jgi:hypothetical protein
MTCLYRLSAETNTAPWIAGMMKPFFANLARTTKHERSILNLLLLLSLLGLSSAGPAWRGGRRSSDFVERCKTNAECIRSHQPLLRPAKRIPKSDSRTLVDRSVYTAPFAFSTPGLYTVSVDTNGTYHISVTGGSGGNGGLTGNTYTGGAAATIQGEFYLTTDQTFFMVVGCCGFVRRKRRGWGRWWRWWWFFHLHP